MLISSNGLRQVANALGTASDLLKTVKTNDWNDYTILARGGIVTLRINHVTMSELDDRDPKRLVRGWLGLQVHTGPPMRVQFKAVFFRPL